MTNTKRVTERLIQYWQLMGAGNNLPEIQQLNTSTIEDVWPQCFLVSVDNRGDTTYKYEYMGDAIVKAYGQDLTGFTVDHKMRQFPGSVVLKKLDNVLAERKTFSDEGHLLNKTGQMIKYRACFLPFGNEQKGLTHIVVGLSFRVF
jgi:hypothetical protein